MSAKRIGRHSTRSTGLRKLRDSRNRSSLSKANKNIPALEEWDFRDCKVPENELLECYIHEFSRERIFREPSLKRALDGLNRDTEWDLHDRLRTTRGVPYLLELNSPWQCLSADIKAGILKLRHELSTPIRGTPATFSIAQSRRELIMDFRIAKGSHSVSGEDVSSVEYGVFSIDWSYPSTTLKNQFAEWVDSEIKERRDQINKVESEKDHELRLRLIKFGFLTEQTMKKVPLPQVAKKTGKGQTDKLRPRLRALGVCRILRDIQGVSFAISEIEQTYPAALPYRSLPDWYRSKKIVESGLSDLFPGMVAVQKR